MKYTIVIILLVALAVAGCEGTQPNTQTTSLTKVTVAMGYVPNVQFAPYFIAEKKGYFAQEGLQVQFTWGFETDGVKLVGAKKIDFANVSGDQIIQARAQDIPIIYIANYYNAFPISLVSFKEKNIVTPKDLIGKKIGLPCLCGATYTAWRALLYSQKIDPASINVQNIGFTQVQALTNGTVDAIGVYTNNEPVQIILAGKEINEIKIWEYTRLVGNGVATNEDTLRQNPELSRRFIGALLRGIADTIANPSEALQISVDAVPEIGGNNLKTNEAVLNATIPLWKNSRLGETKMEDWLAMEKFMLEAKFIQNDIAVSKTFTNDLLPR